MQQGNGPILALSFWTTESGGVQNTDSSISGDGGLSMVVFLLLPRLPSREKISYFWVSCEPRNRGNTMKKCLLLACMFFLLTGSYLPALAQLRADFNTDITEGCAPLVVKFQDASSGNPASWKWETGSGTVLFLQNPSTTYFNPGIYTVKLVVSNANGSDSIVRSQLIRVHPPPSADFNASTTTGCFPLPIQFTDLSVPESGSLVKWEWDFGDGFVSGEKHPAHTYNTIGNYHVSLRVTNSDGCTNTISRLEHIRISTGTLADFDITSPANCQPPTNVQFTDKSVGTGNLEYLWDFGDGTIATSENPSHTYADPGSYTVSLTITNDFGCVNRAISTNAVNIGSVAARFIAPEQVCAGQAISFTNTSDPIPTGAKWDFGDGGSSTELHPPYVFREPGIYTVTLESHFGNCRDTTTHTIEVLDKPAVDFTTDLSTGCQAPLSVSFSTEATETLTYHWDFGDGNTSTERDPQHTYNMPGAFTVTMTTTNSIGCSETIIRPNAIVIRKAPLTFEAIPQSGCIPMEIAPSAYLELPEMITDYSWNFGDGTYSTEENPVHTYTTPGTYTIRLEYSTASGCRESASTNPIRVGEKPQLDFAASPGSTCAFLPVSFTDLSSSPADTWYWQFGDGSTSEMRHPNHYYSDTGYFNVTLIGWSNGCADTLTLEDIVYIPAPIAKFADSSTCDAPLTRWFTDHSIGATEWYWDFGDGSNSALQHPQHTYEGNGDYLVTLTVKNDTCAHTTMRQINIFTGVADFSASDRQLCTGVPTKFIVTGIHPSIPPTAIWDFGDGPARSGALSAEHAYPKPGVYTVQLMLTDHMGCRDTIVKPTYINVDGPIAGFVSTAGTICANTPVIFTDTSHAAADQPIVSWAWNYGDGSRETLTEGPFQHFYDKAGSYSVSLTVTDVNGCQAAAVQYSSFTIVKPTAAFESPDSLSCTAKPIRFLNRSGQYISEYLWSFGDGRHSTGQQPTISYPLEGSYDIRLVTKDIFGCTDTLLRTGYVRIRDPRALFTVSDSVTTCPPLVAQFTNLSENYNQYEWSFGDNTRPAPTESPSHFYSFPGTYEARLAITSPGGCTDTARRTLIVQGPTGDFSYDVQTGCYPLTVRFSGHSTSEASFVWDYNDGQVEPGDAEAIHTYTDTGSFLPKMILIDPQGCRVPFPGKDTIRALGVVAGFTASNSVICDSGQVNFSNLSIANEPIDRYQWNFAPGVYSVEKNPVHFYKTPGNFPAELVAVTRSGCTDTALSLIPVRVATKPAVGITGDSLACMPATLRFSGELIHSDTTLSWQWNFGNGSTASSRYPVSAIYPDQKEYEVQLIATSAYGCSDTAQQKIRPLPFPAVEAGNDISIPGGGTATITPSYSSDVVNVAWEPLTGLNCSTCRTPAASPQKTTDYTVSVTNLAGCSSKDQITVTVFCDAGNLFVPNTFSPNGDGRNDIFYPRGQGLFTVKSMRIFNRWGELVFEKRDFSPNDVSKGWNGMHGNRPAPQDVYVYAVELVCENKTVLNYKGNVALIR